MQHFKEILHKNKALIIFYLFSGITAAFLSNFNANYFQILADNFTDGSLTLGMIAVYGLALILLCVINYADNYPHEKLTHGVYLDFKLSAMRKISRIDYLAYTHTGTGELVQRIENGAAAGRNILVDFIFRLIRELIPSMAFSMFFIWRINSKVMLVMLLGYIVVFITANILLKALYKIKEHILTNEELLNHFLIRGFTEMVTFRINRRFAKETKRASKAKEEIVSSKTKMKLIHEAFFAIFALIVIFIKIAIIIYAWQSRSMTIGEVIAVITLTDNAYVPIAIFNVLYVQFKLDTAAFARFTHFMSQKDDEQLDKGEKFKSFTEAIKFQNVSFAYESSQILKDFNLSISKGSKTALIGESGSGKSTVIRLLTGLTKPSSGDIWIDAQKLSLLNLNSYYENIAYISQETPIFEGTLRENIIFDENIPDEQILEVLQKVCLGQFLQAAQNGLDTHIGERGVNLSGGERQRLALARLWFSNADIIILDEVTSAMDSLTEETVMGALMEKLKEKTVIMISHRLNIVKDFDQIIELE